jgi:hypothetical protein
MELSPTHNDRIEINSTGHKPELISLGVTEIAGEFSQYDWFEYNDPASNAHFFVSEHSPVKRSDGEFDTQGWKTTLIGSPGASVVFAEGNNAYKIFTLEDWLKDQKEYLDSHPSIKDLVRKYEMYDWREKKSVHESTSLFISQKSPVERSDGAFEYDWRTSLVKIGEGREIAVLEKENLSKIVPLEDWARMAVENPQKFAQLSKEYNTDLESGKLKE